MRSILDHDTDTDPHVARARTRPDVMEAMELLSRRVSGAIVIAGALIAFGLYSGGGEEAPNYQAFAADGELFRVNTDSGTIIACNAVRCTRVLQRGQDLVQNQGGTLFKAPAAPPVSGPPVSPPLQRALPASPPPE